MKGNRHGVRAGEAWHLCLSVWKVTVAEVRELNPAPL